MAIATSLCSSPNHSPNLPTLSLPTIPSSKFDLNLVSNEALVVATATEAVTLARAAAKAAREAVVEAAGVSENWSWSGNNERSNGLVTRRKRKSWKGLEILDVEEERNVENLRFSTESLNNEFLSPREEAECCFILRVFIYLLLLLLLQF